MSCRFSGNYYCVKSVRIWSNFGPYSVRMQENTDQNNSEYGHCSVSLRCDNPSSEFPNLVNAALVDMGLYHFLKLRSYNETSRVFVKLVPNEWIPYSLTAAQIWRSKFLYMPIYELPALLMEVS